MTDDELQEDRKLREIVQKAYGVDEETLLKRLEEADQSVDDSKFEGVEERLCQKFMERVKEEENAAAVENVAAVENATAVEFAVARENATARENAATVEVASVGENTGAPEKLEDPEAANAAAGKTPATPKKVVRLGKKRMLLVAALVALFALAVGSTAIGGKNYFFKLFDNGEKNNLILDNDKNKTDASNLEEAYETISDELNVKVLKLEYIPEQLIFNDLLIDSTNAVLRFDYDGRVAYFIQSTQNKEISANSVSDRNDDFAVTNHWLSQDIGVVKEELEDGTAEYNAQIYLNNTYYWFVGSIPEDEFIKIVEKINFY